MNKCIIESSSSYGATALLRTIAKADIRFDEIQLNVKDYVTDSTDSNLWPLIIKCSTTELNNEEFEIRIHSLTCGYPGAGPRDLVECIKITGFDHCISEKEIFSNKNIIAKFKK